MQGFEPSIDLDFENGFFEKGCQLNDYFFGAFVHFDEATGNCKSAGIRAGGYFGGHLGFSKLLWGASSGTRGHSRKGKSSVCAPSRPRSAAKHFMFTRDYGALGLPTLKI